MGVDDGDTDVLLQLQHLPNVLPSAAVDEQHSSRSLPRRYQASACRLSLPQHCKLCMILRLCYDDNDLVVGLHNMSLASYRRVGRSHTFAGFPPCNGVYLNKSQLKHDDL